VDYWQNRPVQGIYLMTGNASIRMWKFPAVILVLFVFFASFSLYSIRSAAEDRFLQDAMSNLRVLEVAFADIVAHGESFSKVQERIDRLSRNDPRIARLSFITFAADGVLRHVASTMAARVGVAAFPEDVKAMGSGRVVVLKERFGGADCLDITYPVRDSSGRTIGIIGYTVRRSGMGMAPLFLAAAAVMVVVMLLVHFRRVQLAFEADLDRRRRTEEKLREAKAAAERANRLKDIFLANVSHEIRTPLNGIMGMAGLLLRSGINPAQARQARMILNSGERLLAVINDILDFSRIEAGMMTIASDDFDLRLTVAEVMHPLAIRAREKGLTLDWEVDDDVPGRLNGDPGRLAQLLNNLVGNAIKYTDTGGVRLAVTRDGEGDGGLRLLFRVSDSGCGVAPEDRDLIFESFVQAGDAARRGACGTGLGLAISKKVAALMGGDLWLEESGNQGSTFCFAAMFAPAAEPSPAPERADNSVSGGAAEIECRILLAEDEYINRAVVEAMLAGRGWRLTVVENGADAVEAFARERFDVVLMDITMPVMDGFEATARIRELERERGMPRTPVIAMTAHAVSGYRERCLAAGMDDYLTKPFDEDTLAGMVVRHVCRPIPDNS